MFIMISEEPNEQVHDLVKVYAFRQPDKGRGLLMLFKDADGMDGVRIQHDLNPAILRISVSSGLEVAEELFQGSETK
jgi:hypothetical protein